MGNTRMNQREDILRQLGEEMPPWDVVVIGGGATGLGAAVEAASRGYRTLLVERIDFAKGTSSRSTKLAHGGVRYLEQFNLHLVLDALRERGHMFRNAPHLVRDVSFVVPAYSFLSLPYYGAGLSFYERLSGKYSLGASTFLSKRRTAELLPNIIHRGLRGGILYHDGQFDDTRYAIALLRTLQDLGGVAVNYLKVVGLLNAHGKTSGVEVLDIESGDRFAIESKVVINAGGIHAEEILSMEGNHKEPLLTLSQGTHLVLPENFLGGKTALMIPRTSDGRVLFAIPWNGPRL